MEIKFNENIKVKNCNPCILVKDSLDSFNFEHRVMRAFKSWESQFGILI